MCENAVPLLNAVNELIGYLI